jgi:hypothetical protein
MQETKAEAHSISENLLWLQAEFRAVQFQLPKVVFRAIGGPEKGISPGAR